MVGFTLVLLAKVIMVVRVEEERGKEKEGDSASWHNVR